MAGITSANLLLSVTGEYKIDKLEAAKTIVEFRRHHLSARYKIISPICGLEGLPSRTSRKESASFVGEQKPSGWSNMIIDVSDS